MRRDHASWHRLVAVALWCLACDPDQGGARPFDDVFPIPESVPDPMHVNPIGAITPVLFVPSDRAVDDTRIAAVKAGLDDLQAWYKRELGTHRLEMNELQIVNGSLTAQQYLDNDTIWKSGPDELRGKLGYSPWDDGHVVLLVGAGLLGWAGGNGNGNSGFAVVGLESLTDNDQCMNEWWCNPTLWRGSAIHELGHALTLEHSEPPSIMNFHGDYLNKVLLDSEAWPEKTKVRNTAFVRPLEGGGDSGGDPSGGDPSGGDPSGGDPSGGDPSGGDPMPQPSADWSPCNVDTDCASSWCGCNGGTAMVCLPSQDYSKDCWSPKANWEPCASDDECESQWCGCNYGSDMVCLPSQDYPKDCV